MIDGKSGILSVSPYIKPIFESTKQVLTWKNGAKARLFSGDDFESLRGPQFDLVWIDEFAKFKSPKELWEQVQLTLRLGQNPKCIITTTPRPLPLLREIMDDLDTVVTRGTTFENEKNLAPSFLAYMKEKFALSRLSSQELYGEMQLEQDDHIQTNTLGFFCAHCYCH
jgi:phage terminase large subunit-like protein